MKRAVPREPVAVLVPCYGLLFFFFSFFWEEQERGHIQSHAAAAAAAVVASLDVVAGSENLRALRQNRTLFLLPASSPSPLAGNFRSSPHFGRSAAINAGRV